MNDKPIGKFLGAGASSLEFENMERFSLFEAARRSGMNNDLSGCYTILASYAKQYCSNDKNFNLLFTLYPSLWSEKSCMAFQLGLLENWKVRGPPSHCFLTSNLWENYVFYRKTFSADGCTVKHLEIRDSVCFPTYVILEKKEKHSNIVDPTNNKRSKSRPIVATSYKAKVRQNQCCLCLPFPPITYDYLEYNLVSVRVGKGINPGFKLHWTFESGTTLSQFNFMNEGPVICLVDLVVTFLGGPSFFGWKTNNWSPLTTYANKLRMDGT